MKVEERSQDSSVTIVIMLHAKNYLKFDSQERQQIFLLAKHPRWHCGPPPPPQNLMDICGSFPASKAGGV